MKKYFAVLLLCLLLLAACDRKEEKPDASLPGSGTSSAESAASDGGVSSAPSSGEFSSGPEGSETVLRGAYPGPDGSTRDVLVVHNREKHSLTCTLLAEDGSPMGSWTLLLWEGRIMEKQGVEGHTDEELLRLAQDYWDALQKEAAQALSSSQKEGILAAINETMDRYRDGTLPGPYVLESDATQFFGGIPADISLPEQIAWESLEINLSSEGNMYSLTFDASLPLDNDYAFRVWGWTNDDADGEWTAGGGGFSDLRGSQSFPRVETGKGTFTNLTASRLFLQAEVSNLSLPGFPAENTGLVYLNRATGDVSLSFGFPDGNHYTGYTLDVERYPGAWAPPLSPEEEKKSVALCREILEEALASAQGS